MLENIIDRLVQTVHVIGVHRTEAVSRERHGDRAGRSEREAALMEQLAALERRAQ